MISYQLGINCIGAAAAAVRMNQRQSEKRQNQLNRLQFYAEIYFKRENRVERDSDSSQLHSTMTRAGMVVVVNKKVRNVLIFQTFRLMRKKCINSEKKNA